MKKVNIRPDEINRALDGLLIPMNLKAGMIGNMEIKVLLKSM